MRILSLLAFLGVIAVASPALADAGLGCGCGGDDTSNLKYDLSVTPDLRQPDMARPADLAPQLDARRDCTRRRRTAGAGSIVLAGLALSGVAFARRRVRA